MVNDEKVKFKSVYIKLHADPLRPKQFIHSVIIKTEDSDPDYVIGECAGYWSAEILAKGVAKEYNIPVEEFRN